MPPKSNVRKIKGSNRDSDASNSNVSAPTKPTNKKQPRNKSGNISTSTTNEPSSASPSTVGTKHPRTLPVAADATAAAPKVPLSGGKKPRRAGFREQFLQRLRVMLDRESQNDGATVHWSTGGNSFIITDQTQFEEEIIPTYFGNPIVFASFLRKLQRWGFVRVSSIRSGRYEFSSPTFKRMDTESAPSPAVGNAATANVAVNDGGSVSIPLPQQKQQQQQHRQQVMAQLNQHPMPVPNQLPRRQANGSAIADLVSNIQRSIQQPFTSSQPLGPNQHTNQTNVADVNNILQNIMGRLLSGQNSLPNQQPMPNHVSQLNNAAGINLQSLPQWQHPNIPTMNLLNAALQGSPPTQTIGQYPVPSAQSNAVHSLMSLFGMLPQSFPLNTASAVSQHNNMEPLLLSLLALQRFVDEEDQRRIQVDALHHAIIVSIGRILGQGFHNNNAARPEQVGAPPISRQSVGSNNNNVAQPNQVGAPHPSVGSNAQADSIAAILQATLRGDATAQPGENARAQNSGPADDNNSDNEDDIDEDSGEDEQHFTKRRKSSPDDEDEWDSDDE